MCPMPNHFVCLAPGAAKTSRGLSFELSEKCMRGPGLLPQEMVAQAHITFSTIIAHFSLPFFLFTAQPAPESQKNEETLKVRCSARRIRYVEDHISRGQTEAM